MFQFRRFPPYTYGFSVWYTGMTPCGFPHSEICGSMDICSSPQLIAAYHVFLRLPVPRHSPCALSSLTNSCRYPFRHTSGFYFANKRTSKLYLPILFQVNKPHMSFCSHYSVFKVHREWFRFTPLPKKRSGGLKWTRTIDLALIRRAL